MAMPRGQQTWANIVYDTFLWTFSIIIELFFREVHPRSTWKVPKKGPIIIVAAPHANQFVDSLILMRILRMDCLRRVCFLIAEKSTKRAFIGWGARTTGSVPVGRALDMKKPAEGKIYLPDPEGDPTLIRGNGTDFKSAQFEVGGLLVLPSVNNEAANAEIKEILGPNEIRLKKPFKGAVGVRQLTGQPIKDVGGQVLDDKAEPRLQEGYEGIKFSVAPHIDQSQVYSKVFEKLAEGGCIGMFPEGGSHDRTELLPLKAGVAIMALGALAENPDCGLSVIPCGMNYFHAHKFRSRAVVEFGTPVSIPAELVEKYKTGERREAVGKVLELIYDALVSVTVQSPDYDTLMLIQAVRRLYNPKGKKLPLPVIVELNRRLVKGYQIYKDDPRIISLKKSILAYNRDLMMLNIRDHQISYAKFSILRVIATLFYRLGKLAVLSVAVLPGTILFAPVFIAGKAISIKKSKEALAASSVKIKARDVVATWKLLVALALAPALYTFYTILFTVWTYRNRIGGRVPEWVPLWAVVVLGYIIFPAITFAALRFGEVGMDIAKSLRPLVLSLIPHSGSMMYRLREQRAKLVEQVTDVINELGPELFPDFDRQRLVDDPNDPTTSPRAHSDMRRSDSSLAMTRKEGPPSPITERHRTNLNAQNNALPRNESFHNLGSFGVFSSRPATPTGRSRSRTNSDLGSNDSGSLKPMTSIGGKSDMDEVSQRIRGAMKERGRRRKSEEVDGSWILPDERDVTDTSDFEPDEAKKDI